MSSTTSVTNIDLTKANVLRLLQVEWNNYQYRINLNTETFKLQFNFWSDYLANFQWIIRKWVWNLFLSLESPKSVLDVCSSSDSIWIFAKYGLGCICDLGIGAFFDCPKCRSASVFASFSSSRFRRSSRFKWNEKINPPKIIQNTKVPPTQIVVMSCWVKSSSHSFFVGVLKIVHAPSVCHRDFTKNFA